MDEARRYEARPEGTSFRGFIEQLEAEAESGEAAEAPVVEEGTEGVRIMTVHSAKGLEFPVVILADITCNETRKEAQRLVDPERKLCLLRLAGCSPRELLERNDVERRRDQEEAERLLYVATTRARDLLVIPAVGDNVPVDQPDATSKGPRWLDKLTPVIFPPNENRRAPTSRHLPDGTEFGDDSVLVRPDNAPGKAKSVAPGFHRPMNGEHAVLWWDPFQLKLDAQDTMGLRQMKLLAADESKKFSQAGIAAHQRWQTRRQEILARGAAPSTRIITATELVATEKPEEASALVNAAIEIERMEQAANRPHGKRFGTLVHLLMLSAPFNAERALISRLAAFHARMLGCLEVEVSAAIDAVLAALKSNTIAMARAAGARCRRECAALVNLKDGTLVEGIADLAFQGANGSGWTVVDFKTDVEIAGRLEEYRAQLGLYMRAIEQSTSLPVKGILLWI
jgi:ATP-dependent exoDNAse (exonuclease V) beta subunit